MFRCDQLTYYLARAMRLKQTSKKLPVPWSLEYSRLARTDNSPLDWLIIAACPQVEELQAELDSMKEDGSRRADGHQEQLTSVE
eukprot:4307631-Amphidinium_carterae.1